MTYQYKKGCYYRRFSNTSSVIYFESHRNCHGLARQRLEPDGLIDASSIDSNHGIVADGTRYTSGQVGWDESFELAGEDVAAQTHKAFENVEMLLEDVDRSLADVTKVTAHVVDFLASREAFFTLWNDVFSEPPYPYHTLLGPQQLAQERLLVEFEVEVPIDKEPPTIRGDRRPVRRTMTGATHPSPPHDRYARR
ncbi:RidA family protein [Natrinema gelatinilyticum]|uniref:RidA family protein n=1 Tax=Natrinema gelatinilyticum TaxID=2961571 RepID=UPI0020C1E3BB|nr:RidA family protein [Natrinema gelatinilyticum]